MTAAIAGEDGPARIRLDKWLWQARFYKTRGLAAKAVAGGSVRLNAQRVLKPATGVAVGDGLTVVLAGQVRIVRILGLGTRRGPAPEARALYEDLAQAERDGRQPEPPPPEDRTPARGAARGVERGRPPDR